MARTQLFLPWPTDDSTKKRFPPTQCKRERVRIGPDESIFQYRKAAAVAAALSYSCATTESPSQTARILKTLYLSRVLIRTPRPGGSDSSGSPVLRFLPLCGKTTLPARD